MSKMAKLGKKETPFQIRYPIGSMYGIFTYVKTIKFNHMFFQGFGGLDKIAVPKKIHQFDSHHSRNFASMTCVMWRYTFAEMANVASSSWWRCDKLEKLLLHWMTQPKSVCQVRTLPPLNKLQN